MVSVFCFCEEFLFHVEINIISELIEFVSRLPPLFTKTAYLPLLCKTSKIIKEMDIYCIK